MSQTILYCKSCNREFHYKTYEGYTECPRCSGNLVLMIPKKTLLKRISIIEKEIKKLKKLK